MTSFFQRLAERRRFGMRPGLDTINRLVERLGHPERDLAVIHIAGTNGKGAVAALCESVLRAAGYPVARYTSPHLVRVHERYLLNGAPVKDAMLEAAAREVEEAVLALEVQPDAPETTFFECLTAVAFVLFRQAGIRLAVLETGLGGRLDATNIVTPLVSVITRIGLDHCDWLGDTVEQIAAEKAGIIKPGVPVVSAPQADEAAAVLEAVAAERGSPLIVIGRDWEVVPGHSTRQGQRFLAGPAGQLREYWTPLAGRHQAINGAVALAALTVVRERGLPLPPALVDGGKLQANWPGRFEIVGDAPVVVLDAAHNGASAECLRDTVLELFPDRAARVLVFGASADKDVAGMFRALLPVVDHLVLTHADHPRALDVESLAAEARAVGFNGPVEQIPAVAGALEQARLLAGPAGVVVLTGSLFVVGEARNALGLAVGRAAYLDAAVTPPSGAPAITGAQADL